MPDASRMSSPETVSRPQVWAIPRYAIVLWACALMALSFGAWSVTRSEEIPPAYYVVKWESSGKCSVVNGQPDRSKARLLWFSTLYESAARKSREFRKTLRCK